MKIEVLSYGELIYTHIIEDKTLWDRDSLTAEENFKRRELILSEHIKWIARTKGLSGNQSQYVLCFESKITEVNQTYELLTA